MVLQRIGEGLARFFTKLYYVLTSRKFWALAATWWAAFEIEGITPVARAIMFVVATAAYVLAVAYEDAHQ